MANSDPNSKPDPNAPAESVIFAEIRTDMGSPEARPIIGFRIQPRNMRFVLPDDLNVTWVEIPAIPSDAVNPLDSDEFGEFMFDAVAGMVKKRPLVEAPIFDGAKLKASSMPPDRTITIRNAANEKGMFTASEGDVDIRGGGRFKIRIEGPFPFHPRTIEKDFG